MLVRSIHDIVCPLGIVSHGLPGSRYAARMSDYCARIRISISTSADQRPDAPRHRSVCKHKRICTVNLCSTTLKLCYLPLGNFGIATGETKRSRTPATTPRDIIATRSRSCGIPGELLSSNMMVDDDLDGTRPVSNFNNTGGTAQSFASTFRSNAPGMARTAEELRKARESRAADALMMKDEQINILSSQNNNLLKQLEAVSAKADVPPDVAGLSFAASFLVPL